MPSCREPLKLTLEKKLRDRSARVGIIGLGYLGLPLAVEIAKQGFQVTGIDINRTRVDSVNAGISFILDVPDEALLPLVTKKRIKATQSLSAIEHLEVVDICVPTPIRRTKDLDLRYIVAAVEAVGNHLQPGQLIVIESMTYPGTTREVVLPILEKSGLRVGKDFFLVCSPARVESGNPTYSIRTTPKVIGGVTPLCNQLASAFYQQFVERTVPVSSPDTAEMVKLLENTFSSVNIALANEMAVLCQKSRISVWEVIEAAKTKPFDFMGFYPGPAIRSYRIPPEEYYVIGEGKRSGSEPRLIELAGQINDQILAFTIGLVADALNGRRKNLKGAKLLGLGITRKPDNNDVRESPAVEALRGFHEKGALVSYSDPYVPTLEFEGRVMPSINLTPQVLSSIDCAVILTDHSSFDYAMIASRSPLILDCRNALKDFAGPNIVRL